MKFLTLLLLLFCSIAFADPLQPTSYVGFGGGISSTLSSNPFATVPQTDAGNVVTLTMTTNAGTAGNCYWLVSTTEQFGLEYQVPSTVNGIALTKGLVVTGVYLEMSSSGGITFATSTASYTSNSACSGLTGIKYYGAGSQFSTLFTPGAGQYYYYPFTMVFPPGTYPSVEATGTAAHNMLVIGRYL